MDDRQRPTLKQIADEAGVSVSTVSLVLNNRPGVSAETRREVRELLQRVGYKRDGQGRPAAARSGALAFVVYDADAIEASHNPFFAEIQKGIEAEARSEGYELRVVYAHERDDLSALVRKLKALHTLGVILDASVMPQDKLRPFVDVDIPLVILDNEYPEASLDSVVIDNVSGAHAAVQHLIDLGHQRIGICSTSIPTHNFRQRETAAQELMESSGLGAADVFIRVRPTIPGSYADCLRALKNVRSLPSAFFATNDIMASGLVRALHELAVQLPEEVSVVGFDDLSFCELMQPSLSTVRVFKSRMATLAVQRLTERIVAVPPETVVIRIGTLLVPRASTARARAHEQGPAAAEQAAGGHPADCA